MTNKLLLFAGYYLFVALFAPNPIPNEPNKFAIIMLWVSLAFSTLAVNVFLYNLALRIFPDKVVEEYESVEFVGSEVRA